MIADAQLVLSDAQALTATARSTNVIDLSAAAGIGTGEPLSIVLTVDVAADATTGDETYTVAIQTDDNAAFSSATTISSQAITAATLSAGSQHIIPVPSGASFERYLSLYYTLAGTTPTATVTAMLMPTHMVPHYRAYADNITIS